MLMVRGSQLNSKTGRSMPLGVLGTAPPSQDCSIKSESAASKFLWVGESKSNLPVL